MKKTLTNPKVKRVTKEEIITQAQTTFERKVVEHKWVAVFYQVDYINRKVSLVDQFWLSKKWDFSGRETPYQIGWHNILEAMKIAMDMGFASLKTFEEQQMEKHIKAHESLLSD